ncbi:glutamate decarboxylase [Paeniglutamicibacter cryotolerans]|uniref:Glutamate decarboxylase n=1 Tax=Paeniglutamicibacter cryotolerans TaxID=670079 RepID=A0A839QKB4_9MICC|nr:glutamate decarboxylase [Paeniglutamicibacter cryotolerans]MBB2996043.1 glutamate decarboxylase [Paeniglutamicibacter cryotolerans]
MTDRNVPFNPYDDVYSSSALRAPAPRKGFPEAEADPRAIYQLVHDELLLDGVSRMNLATFCSTWIEPEAQALMAESIDKNIVDKDEYPQAAELENRCVHMLADLFHAPDPAGSMGTSTIGSSEAAMMSGLAAKWRWKARRQAAGLEHATPNIVSGSVQVCWEKFARYFDVELRQVPMNDRYLLTPEEVLAAVDENTIAVVSTFGQTFTGMFEDVAGISAALDGFQERTGLDIPLHVDAASGGFVAPFCAPEVIWDFRLPRVKSINVSGHKTGLAPLGSGWAIWRERADLPEELIFKVNYLGGEMPTFNLNFSRPGGQVICSYYNFLRLGREGYAKVQGTAYEVAAYLAREIAALGRFEMVFEGQPDHGIPAVTWKHDSGEHAHSLFDLADELRMRGWLVPAYTLPPAQEEVAVQRVIVRRGFSLDMAQMLLEDLSRALDKLDARPPAHPMLPSEGSNFNHNATPVVSDAMLGR